MRVLLLVAAAVASAIAKPGTYREKEDFQFSRSSSDDGNKSGYYGAQRGNTGGNYERAHNMDLLAQNQMSGLVKQVEGELGDGSKTRTGSVYTAANTRGVYGSGQYDLSNLAGRNFEDGVSYGESQSQSSSMNSAYQHQSSSATKSGFNSNQYQSAGHSGGYREAGYTGQIQSSNLQGQAAIEGNRASEYNNYGQRERTGYYTHSGNHRQSAYENTNSASSTGYGSNVNSRLISTTPVRVVVRPGLRVNIPVAAQTYDDSQRFSSNGQNSDNSEAEVLSNPDYQTIYQVTTKPKHYESSYRYQKEWEKHDTKPVEVPLAIPTANSFPLNSELYEDIQAHKTDGQFDATGVSSLNKHSSTAYSGYNANSAASGQSQYRTNYNSNAHGYNAYNSAQSVDSTNQVVGDLNTKPKSYQSSYAYHKSWERQGDPYVIRPASGSGAYDGQASQKFSAASSNQGAYVSHQYGSHDQQSQRYINSNTIDCDDNSHIRVARSYDTQQAVNFDENQQSQNKYVGQEELSQKSQNLEDLGQQSQIQLEKLEDVGQQAQNKWDNVEDLGQQTQQKWDNLEDLGQQAQNKWDDLEDLGQQTQQKWEDVGQQAQNKWDNVEDQGQQTQQKWDKLEVAGQQAQNKWDNLEDLGQQTQKDLGQQSQDTRNSFDFISQENDGQQTQNNWDNLSELHRQVQKEDKISQTVTHIEPDNLHSFGNYSSAFQKETDIKPDTHQVQTIWDKIGSLDQNRNKNENINNMQENTQKIFNFEQNQFNWQHVSHNENDDQLRNTQNEKPVWEQNADDTQQNVNTGVVFNPYPMNNLGYSHRQGQTGHPGSFNMNTQADIFLQNPNVYVTPNAGGDHSSNLPSSQSLGNLWDKIDNIVKDTKSNDTTNLNSNNFESTSFQHSYQNLGQAQSNNFNFESVQSSNHNSGQAQTYHNNNNFDSSQVYQNNQLVTDYIGYQPIIHNENKTTTEKSIHNKHLKPQDIGRGDIGPEDEIQPTTKTDNTLELSTSPEIKPTYRENKYKTSEDIDSLNLTKEHSNSNENNNMPPDTQFGILSLNQQKWLDGQKQQAENTFSNSISSTTTVRTTPKGHESSTNNQHFDTLVENQQNVSRTEDSSNTENISTYYKLNTTTHLDQGTEDIYQHNKGHNVENNMDQKEYSHPNFEQQYVDLNQENDKVFINNDQHYVEFGQHNENINPQTVESQFVGVGQQNDRNTMEQQFESFGQPIEQQNMEQQFESFGQANNKFDQQNVEDQVTDFGKMEQPFVDLGQHPVDLSQTSQAVWNEHLEDFGQHVQTPWNPNDGLKQQDDIQKSGSIESTPIPLHKEVKDPNLETSPNNIKPNVDSVPPEEVTENPGFWKSVGNKFTGAKDKVFSWFKKS